MKNELNRVFSNSTSVEEILKESCEIVLKGNCDESVSSSNAKAKNFWSRLKIGEDRANYLSNLPIYTEFYMSGRLVRLFHASPYSLSHIYNPMFSNRDTLRETIEINSPLRLFDNTDFLGKTKDDPIPDIIGYGHIHTPNIVRYKNKTISIMQNGKILNPVDLRENLVEEYTTKRLGVMDKWIDVLSKFIDIEDDKEFRQTIHNDINMNIFADSFDTPKKITEPTKPWLK